MRAGELAQDRLVFLISQPRAGSSLLQHILGSHSRMGTLPEPWVMLPFAQGLHGGGFEREYNARYAGLALEGFLGRLANGRSTYLGAIRRMAQTLYGEASASLGKDYFVDKTPRYYLIIRELREIFPEAHFIFLIRNPLAVLTSILKVNLNGDVTKLFRGARRHDILTAPQRILEGLEEGDCATHYETLVTNPEEEIRRVCDHIGVKYEPEMLRYGDKVHFYDTTFVDPATLYNHEGPEERYAERWWTRLDSEQKVHIANCYLECLGEKVVTGLGYDYGSLRERLTSVKVKRDYFLIPWELLIGYEAGLPLGKRLKLKALTEIRRVGLVRGIWRLLKHIMGALK